ncbi:MAG: hypothetical protein AAF563_03470 [Pseudomonadota bacterium]
MPPADKPYAWRLAEAVATAGELLESLDIAKRAHSSSIGFGDLYRYATDPQSADSATAAALADNPGLAADWRRLMQNLAVYSAPMAAAAADRAALDRRYGDGWSLRLREVRKTPDQVWVIITFDRLEGTTPSWLFAGTLRHALPEATDGQMQFRIAADAPLVGALRDPATELFLL